MLKRRKTDTAVKYLVAQSLPEAEVSDLMSTATDGNMVRVTLMSGSCHFDRASNDEFSVEF
jgi:hypothetical protein